MHKFVGVHLRHRSLVYYAVSVRCPTSVGQHLVPHQTTHSHLGYWVQTTPTVLNKYRDQSQLDDWDRWTLTNDVQWQGRGAFVVNRYHRDVTNSVLVNVAVQDTENWLNRSDSQHSPQGWPSVRASIHIFHNVHPSSVLR